MKSKIDKTLTTETLEQYLARNGKITICKPKQAPKRRKLIFKTLTPAQIKSKMRNKK